MNAVIRQNLPAETKVMAPAGGHRGRRHGAVRREVRRQRARADPGPGAGRRGRPIRSSCAAAPTWRAPATSPCSRSSPRRGIAAGVRRIEALTGEAARRYLLDQAGVAKALAEQFKVPVAEVAGPRRGAAAPSASELEKELADAKRQLAMGGGGGGARPPVRRRSAASSCIGPRPGRRRRQGPAAASPRSSSKQLGPTASSPWSAPPTARRPSPSPSPARPSGRFNAADLAKAAVLAMGGQGAGGKPDFAQGGAPDGSKADDGLAAVKAALAG